MKLYNIFSTLARKFHIKEASLVFIGQAIGIVGSLVLIKICTNQLSMADYGRLTLGLAVGGVINQVVLGPIAAGVSRFYNIAQNQNEIRRFLLGTLRLTLFTTIMLMIISIIVMMILYKSREKGWTYQIGITLIYSIIFGVFSLLNGIQNSARNRTMVVFNTVLDAIIRPAFLGLLILADKINATSVVAAYLAAVTLIVAIQITVLYYQHCGGSDEGDSVEFIKQILRYSWPFAIWGCFSWAQQSSDRWSLEYFSDASNVGAYSVLFQLGYSPGVIISGMLMMFFAPLVYQKYGSFLESKGNKKVSHIISRLCIVSFGVTLTLFLIALVSHQYLISIFSHNNYDSVSYLLPWMILSSGLFSTGQIFALKIMGELDTRRLIPMKIGTSLIGVSLNSIGAFLFGLVGVVMAINIYSMIYFIWSLALAYPKYQKDERRL